MCLFITESSVEDSEEEIHAKKGYSDDWGRRKVSYYDADTADLEIGQVDHYNSEKFVFTPLEVLVLTFTNFPLHLKRILKMPKKKRWLHWKLRELKQCNGMRQTYGIWKKATMIVVVLLRGPLKYNMDYMQRAITLNVVSNI